MKLLSKIYNIANDKLFFIAFATFIFFMSFVLPNIAELTAQYGDGPDTMLQFSLCPYYTARTAYGVEGRRMYIILRWTFDVVWPIVYTFFYAMAIGFIGKKANDSIGFKWLLVPVIAVLFDFLENIFATIFMASYPNDVTIFVHLLIISSTVKWIFVGLSFMVIIYLFIKWAVKRNEKSETTV